MSEVHDDTTIGKAVIGPISDDVELSEDALKSSSATLVEIHPGIAAVLGEAPAGLELIELDDFSPFERDQLAIALGGLSNLGAAVGNMAVTAQNVSGLYRLSDETRALLSAGGKLATKDGAYLGGIFQNGKIIGQARLIPVSATGIAQMAHVSSAIAMMAMQVQIKEVSQLVETNIKISEDILKQIRQHHWARHKAIAKVVNDAVREASELGSVTESIWEPVSAHKSDIEELLNLSRQEVSEFLVKIKGLKGKQKREFLQWNAESFVFNAYAQLSALKSYAQYQALRASIVKARSNNNEKELELYHQIMRDTPAEYEAALSEIRAITNAIVNELKFIVAYPGQIEKNRVRKRKEKNATTIASDQLLAAIDPLAKQLEALSGKNIVRWVPMDELEIISAPSNLELVPFLKPFNYLLEEDEPVRAIAFALPQKRSKINPSRAFTNKTLTGLVPNKAQEAMQKRAPSMLIAITDRRIITADSRELKTKGEIGPEYSLDDVRFVRSCSSEGPERGIDVTTEREDLQWRFSVNADSESIESLAALVSEGTSHPLEKPEKREISEVPNPEN